MNLRILARVGVIFFLYIIISYFYIGFTTKPTEGDSVGYHIPIAKSYLDGNIISPSEIDGTPYLKYSPASPHAILSVFYFLRIPNLFNVFGICLLFASLLYLGKKVGFEKNYRIIFAVSIVTLNAMIRWLDTQIIDIYLASFFALTLAFLQKIENKKSYFFKLGWGFGLLIGSKYSGLIFGLILIVVYLPKLIKALNTKNFTLFLIGTFLFGGIWYLRNFIVTGNPMYPQGFLIFKDGGFTILYYQVWKVFLGSWQGFSGTINAFISEYMIWCLSIPLVLFFYLKSLVGKENEILKKIFPFVIIGVLNLIFYLFLPSSFEKHIMVSVIRYAHAMLIPFVICVFIIFKESRREEQIAILTISNMFFGAFPASYNPKLIFIFVPVALLFYFARSKPQ